MRVVVSSVLGSIVATRFPGVFVKIRRFFLLVIVLALSSGAQLLVGRSEQAPRSSAAPPGPFDSLHFRRIGPAGMSGRITDVAVYEPDPAIFFVGSAHGG